MARRGTDLVDNQSIGCQAEIYCTKRLLDKNRVHTYNLASKTGRRVGALEEPSERQHDSGVQERQNMQQVNGEDVLKN